MDKPVGYAVVVAENLTQSRSVSFQFNFAQGASAEEMGAELDKLTRVLDRQKARAEIEGREQYLKAQKLILANLETDIGRGESKLTTLEPDPMRRNRNHEIKSLSDAVEKQKIMIEDVKAKIKAAEDELDDLRKKAA